MIESGTLWVVVALTALTTLLIRGIGPFATGARELPEPAVRVVVLLAPALIAALVVTNALADGDRLHLGPDTAGTLVAALLLWRRTPVLAAVVVAAAVAAGLRAVGVQ